jgi:hypothetical protein
MRRPIVLTDIGLNLDDPTTPDGAAGRLVDQVDAEERRGDLERRSGEQRGGVLQEATPKSAFRSLGSSSPNTVMKPGIRRERSSSAVNDVS